MVFICFPLSIAKMRLEASVPQRSSLPLSLIKSLCVSFVLLITTLYINTKKGDYRKTIGTKKRRDCRPGFPALLASICCGCVMMSHIVTYQPPNGQGRLALCHISLSFFVFFVG